MAAIRVPRFCAAVSLIGTFTTSSTYCLPRIPQQRSHLCATRCRSRKASILPQHCALNFSTTALNLSDAVTPPGQESEAYLSQRSGTPGGRQTGAAESIAEEQHHPSTHTTSPPPSPSPVKLTPKPSIPPSPAPQPTKSDRRFGETSRRITGTVIRTHTMAKTVAVATTRQYFDRFLQKHYTRASKTLVHDPNEMLVEGDVIEYALFPPAERAQRIKMGKGKRVKYLVVRVVTPFGMPLEQRTTGTVTPVGTALGEQRKAAVEEREMLKS